jgi:hypothetical protein
VTRVHRAGGISHQTANSERGSQLAWVEAMPGQRAGELAFLVSKVR